MDCKQVAAARNLQAACWCAGSCCGRAASAYQQLIMMAVTCLAWQCDVYAASSHEVSSTTCIVDFACKHLADASTKQPHILAADQLQSSWGWHVLGHLPLPAFLLQQQALSHVASHIQALNWDCCAAFGKQRAATAISAQQLAAPAGTIGPCSGRRQAEVPDRGRWYRRSARPPHQST